MKTIKLTYLKQSGKYYTEGTYQTNKEHMFDICQEIREMTTHPGLSEKWRAGFIYVEGDYPQLIILGD